MNYPTTSVIGLTLDKAKRTTRQQIRPMKVDGVSFFNTNDYIHDRMNVEIVDGKIVSILNYG